MKKTGTMISLWLWCELGSVLFMQIERMVFVISSVLMWSCRLLNYVTWGLMTSFVR